MNSSPRQKKIIASVIAACALLWFGINVYAGKRAESWLQEFVAASEKSHSYRLRNLHHQRGLLSSQGYVDVALIDDCGSASRPGWMTTRLTYQLKHTVFPLALMNIDWSIEPLGAERDVFEKFFGVGTKLEGRGKVGLNGDVHSDMKLPEIQFSNKGTRVTVSPSVGSVIVGKDTLTQVLEKAGRMDIDVTPEMKSLEAGGKQFKNLVFDFGIHGLHGESADYVFNLAQTSCNFQNLTQEDSDKLHANLRKLLFEGFSVGISRVAGAVDGGDLDGKWSMTLAKTPGEEFSLMPVLTSQGELSLTGKDIKQIQKKTLISLGFAQEIPDGMRASYQFANGVLKVNGKVSNAALIDTMLQTIEQQILEFLNGQQVRRNGDSPEEGEPAEAAEQALET